jgi:DnaJ-class molecular chaperone
MEFRDYYATLGVPKTATDREIKQAFRKLARKHHPDVNPGDRAAEKKFKEINEANEVLSDPEKRRKYDELGSNWRLYDQAQPPHGGGAQSGAGWPGGAPGGGFRTMTPEEAEQVFGADVFSDFFRTFFSGGPETGDAGRRAGRGSRGTRRRSGEDVEQELPLTLEEAYHGTMRRLAVKSGGHARAVDVRIPAGVKDGARVRVAGEGEAGSGGAPSGDLYLRVRLGPHPRFERKGQHLYVTVPVPVTVAALGGEVSVMTLAGKYLRLKIPEGTQNGQVFRFRGQGMPSVGHPDEHGDLFATVEVQVPRSLTPDQRHHYEALAKLEDRQP